MPREHPGGLGITIKVASSQQDQVLLPTCPHLELKLCDPEQLLTRAQPQGQGPERGGLGPEARETFTLSQQQLGGTSPGTDTGVFKLFYFLFFFFFFFFPTLPHMESPGPGIRSKLRL